MLSLNLLVELLSYVQLLHSNEKGDFKDISKMGNWNAAHRYWYWGIGYCGIVVLWYWVLGYSVLWFHITIIPTTINHYHNTLIPIT